MAAQDGPDHLDLDRARRLAARLVERFDLTPPVDVRAILDRYADVEAVSIPTDCDALVIGLNRAEIARPRVIVNHNKPKRRQRFSMAHELGHILIPGHVSMEVCFVGEEFYDSSSNHEREAHEFASELLMPSAWVSGIVADSDHLDEVFAAAAVANVSAAAAMMAIHRHLPPHEIIALMKSGHEVEMALVSPGTVAKAPYRGQRIDRKSIDVYAGSHGTVSFHGRTICWWEFDAELDLGPDDDDERSASEVLREIVDDLSPIDPKARLSKLGSINGIAGWAKGAFNQSATVEEMFARLKARFANRPEHSDAMSHPLFETYLRKKARELHDRGLL
jgi:IrrE N-terminal-like domain